MGKLACRSPSAAGPSGQPRPATLGLIVDEISRRQCLIDTGSQVSFWPASKTTSMIKQSCVRLTAANGIPIEAYGQQWRKIKNRGKFYSFVFLLAQVARPILGLDLLLHFKMTIDLGKRQLVHSGQATRLSSANSNISGVNMVSHSSSFSRILKEFPEITDVNLAYSTTQQGVECYINTHGPPVNTASRRLTPEKLQVAKKYFEMMCAAGICRRSDSPWSSGLHIVPKKEGSFRPCGDYRHLNVCTSGDAYPIPHVHDFAAGLAGCRVFSKIDLVKGYHQVPVHVADVPKMAIATPFGLFEFTRMPFGLKTAAQTFQRLMDSVTAKLRGVFVYIDDVLVASETAEQHESDLRQLFGALKRCGLVLNRDKCVFGVSEIQFLGHTVSERGIKPLPSNVEAVRRFERPRTVKALQRFLGLINFYRRFLPKVAASMRPLTDALAGKPRRLEWTEAKTSAFVETKNSLASATNPVSLISCHDNYPPATMLFHPVAGAELRVHTDTSARAIAGAIHQVVNGRLQPLGFFSRWTSPVETQYSAYDLELLAVYSTILKFRHMLEGRKFRIVTDQRPLKSAFIKARDPVSNRQRHQLAFISEFVTDIAHVPGLANLVAEALSCQYDDVEDPAVVNAIVHTLADVNLAAPAREQLSIKEEPSSSLKLEPV